MTAVLSSSVESYTAGSPVGLSSASASPRRTTPRHVMTHTTHPSPATCTLLPLPLEPPGCNHPVTTQGVEQGGTKRGPVGTLLPVHTPDTHHTHTSSSPGLITHSLPNRSTPQSCRHLHITPDTHPGGRPRSHPCHTPAAAAAWGCQNKAGCCSQTSASLHPRQPHHHHHNCHRHRPPFHLPQRPPRHCYS